MVYTYSQFAKLVQQLRAVQKANGSGYKSATASTQATALEKEVDAVAAEVVKFWPFDKSEKSNG